MSLRNKKNRKKNHRKVPTTRTPSKEAQKVKKLIDEVSKTNFKEIPQNICEHTKLNSESRCESCGALVECTHPNLSQFGRCRRCGAIGDDCSHLTLWPNGRCRRCGVMTKEPEKKSPKPKKSSTVVKQCLLPDVEHTVHWCLSMEEAPYAKVYMTKKASHDEMLRFVEPGFQKSNVMWMKSFCTNKEFYNCFEWRRL